MNNLFFVIVLLGLVFLLTHFFAVIFYMYWFYWWSQILVHFLGGLWVGLVFLWLIFFVFSIPLNFNRQTNFVIFLLTSIFFTFIIAVVWEIFEFQIGFTSYSQDYFFDTVSDLLVGVSGGMLASIWAYRVYCSQK